MAWDHEVSNLDSEETYRSDYSFKIKREQSLPLSLGLSLGGEVGAGSGPTCEWLSWGQSHTRLSVPPPFCALVSAQH